MGNIKILISCHKQSIVPDSEIMLPIEVGADLRSKHIEGYIQDNSGDNISAKNKKCKKIHEKSYPHQKMQKM